MLVAAEGTVQSQTDALEYLQQQSEVLHRGLGRPAELRELLDRAAGWWPDPTWHERLEPLRLLLSQFEEFRGGLSRPAQILTDADLDPELRNRLEPIQVANLFYSGQARAAHELAERIHPLPVRTVTDAIALSLWCRIALEDGEQWSELDGWTCATLDAAVRLSDHATAGQAAYSLACLRTMAGRYVDADLLLAESEAQLERHDPLGLLCVINAQQVIVAAARGERA